MTIKIESNDLLTIDRVGLKALNKALGVEGTQVFLQQYVCRFGNFAKERHEMPEPTYEEFIEELRKVNKEEVDRAFGEKTRNGAK